MLSNPFHATSKLSISSAQSGLITESYGTGSPAVSTVLQYSSFVLNCSDPSAPKSRLLDLPSYLVDKGATPFRLTTCLKRIAEKGLASYLYG